MEKLKPCPFCGGQPRIQVCDDEGNLHNEDYKLDPWSGLSYMIHHDTSKNPECPIASDYFNGGTIGAYLYDTEETLILAWNKRAI